MRADQARERFKRKRNEAASGTAATAATKARDAATSSSTGLDVDTLSKEQKYNKRLANNRKSAAGARVYNEVIRKETDYILKKMVEKAKKYEDMIDTINNQLSEARKENERLKKRIAMNEGASILKEMGTPVSNGKASAAPTSSGSTTKEENHFSSGARLFAQPFARPFGSKRNIHGGFPNALYGTSSGLSEAGDARSALSTSSGITAESAGSAIPRMPSLNSMSFAAKPHLPLFSLLRPMENNSSGIPSLFGGSRSDCASNTMLRVSQTSATTAVTRIGALGGPQDTFPMFTRSTQ